MKKSLEIEAGRFYIGDPCYVLSRQHGVWKQATDQMCADRDASKDTVYEVKIRGQDGEFKFLAADTACGDGWFHAMDKAHPMYTADSGVLGVVPEALFKVGLDMSDPQWRIFGLDAGTVALERLENGRFNFYNNDRLIESIATDLDDGDKASEDGEDGGLNTRPMDIRLRICLNGSFEEQQRCPAFVRGAGDYCRWGAVDARLPKDTCMLNMGRL